MRLGGIVPALRIPHGPLNGGPQMVEVSRDGRRVYVTNSLYSRGTPSSTRTGMDGWIAKLDVGPKEDSRSTPTSTSTSTGGCPPDPSRRRRRFLGFLLLQLSRENWTSLAAPLLGAFHGLNPAMGWLFAVAIGFRDRARRAVVGALVPIAVGHAASMSLAVLVFNELRLALPPAAIRVAGAVALLAFATARLSRDRHPRWVGMNLSRYELAGLVVPHVDRARGRTDAHPRDRGLTRGCSRRHGDAGAPSLVGGGAVLVHTAAMIAAAAAAALVVYHFVGVGILRRGWLNLDRVWTYALGAGAVVMLLAG